jgi:hypothetical protein
MGLLYKVAENSAVNRMTASNLSIVIAPNILRCHEQSIESIIQDTPMLNAVVESIIKNYPTIFAEKVNFR